MKRFFVFFSIILLLGSNIVLALDVDCLPIQQQETTVDQNTDSTESGLSKSSCHSVAHFVGIYPDILITTTTSRNEYILLPTALMSTQTYQPATPPPNV